ncbi:MAG: gamma-glutamyltransferase [Gemmatimonadetes bacterium]|nr:gamma-glutamyltransferase [Gemmatimonadota bacterium]
MTGLALGLAALAVAEVAAAQVQSPATRSGRSTVYAPRAAVATSQPLATGAALEILARGGNAIDAAVAAAAVLNVTEPHMTGMGGDLFAQVWSAADGKLFGLDASGRSGSKVDLQALLAAGETRSPASGAKAVTVPGALAGWDALVRRFGTMTLGDLLQPAIRLAEEGFPVSPIIAQDWAGQVEKLRNDAGARATYLIDGGRAPQPGEWFRNLDQAATFREIARDGIATFYGGSLGQRFVTGLDRLGGYLTLADLAEMRVRWVEPLSVDYKGYTLHELPPAGQGIAALQYLKMLETVDLASMGHNSARYLHTLIEAKKLVYADLARYIADPDHMTVNPARLLDSSYLARRLGQIDPTRAAARVEPGSLATTSETVYLTVADRHGNIVSLINSIYSYFGSGVVVPGTGILLQNRGAGFVLAEGHPNRLGPKKRPFHTIIPAFVTKGGQPWLSYGVMGGDIQPQGHVQVFLNLVEFGMDLQALDAARFNHLAGTTIAVENLSGGVAAQLRAWGHEIRPSQEVTFGGSQAIMRLGRGWAAASDPRKDGMAAGH